MVVDFEWDSIAIGTSLGAMESAFESGSPVLFNREPYFFEFEESDDGEAKKKKWQRLASAIAIRGLNPFGNKITSIRINDGYLEVICSTKKYKVSYNKIIFFDDENIENFPFERLKYNKYNIYDWFIVRSGASHEYNFLEGTDSFVKKIYFFSKINLPKYKDCVSHSIVEKDNMENFDFSPTMTRMKTINMMKEAGVKGTQHTRTYRYPIKLEFIRREVSRIKEEIFKENGIYILDTRESKDIK
tara:strand:+ start:593 stop:1324 length:732 start_codon:yes stop_codon:yes gene_type:complete